MTRVARPPTRSRPSPDGQSAERTLPEAPAARQADTERAAPRTQIWRWSLGPVAETLLVALVILLPDLYVRLVGDSILTFDTVYSNIPLKDLAVDQLFDGRMPLWTSNLANGMPLLADTIGLPFDPRNLFFAFMGISDAYLSMLLTGRAIGGLIFFHYLRRRHELRFGPALVATFIFLCSTVLYDESRLHSTSTIVYGFPAIIWLTELLLEQPTLRRSLYLSFAWAVLFAVGSVAYLAYVPFLAAAWAVALWFFGERRDRNHLLRFGLAYVGAGIWGLVLTSIALFPFLEYLGESNRGGEYTSDPFIFRSIWFGIFGAHQSSNFVPNFPYFFYVGTLTLPLVLISLRHRDNAHLRALPWLAVLTLVAVGASMTSLKGELIKLIPGVASIAPFRTLFFWAFIAAVLAGYALNRPDWRLGRWTRTGVWGLFGLQAGLLLGLGVIGMFLVVFRTEQFEQYLLWRQSLLFFWPLLTETLFLVLVAVRAAGLGLFLVPQDGRSNFRFRGWRISMRASAAVLLVAELTLAWSTIRPIGDHRQDLYPVTPEVAYLKRNAGLNERVLQVEGLPSWGPPLAGALGPGPGPVTLSLDTQAVHGLRTPNVFESLVIKDYSRAFNTINGYNSAEADTPRGGRASNAALATSSPTSRVIPAFGVRYMYSSYPMPRSPAYKRVFTGEAYYVYEVSHPLPRAYFVSSARRLPRDDVYSSMVATGTPGDEPEFDIRREVLLVGDRQTQAGGTPARFTPAEVVEDTDSTVRVRLNAPRRGYLILTDAFYPGWRATIGGTEKPIELANGFAKAVPVERGSQEVTFRYEPSSYSVGLKITLIAILLSVLFLVGTTARGRRGWERIRARWATAAT